MHHRFAPLRPTRVEIVHHRFAPLRPTCVLNIVQINVETHQDGALCVLTKNFPNRKKWCVLMVFGAFSRPTRATKKFKSFFQTLVAQALKGLFFLVHFLLKSTVLQKVSSL
jgi:hypothetical protein